MKCTFCGQEIEQGKGTIYAKKDGTTYYFCASKCRKNLLLRKYKSHKTKWTDQYNLEKQRHLKKLQTKN
jgi:large subunit ribosomal protein L24e